METARVRLNAFSKDTSGSHSETVEVSSLDSFKELEKLFDNKVPFSRFYCEHEILEGDDALCAVIEQYCDETL